MAETKYVGKTIRGKEAPRHVSGRGNFVDDIVLRGMLHAVIRRSPHAHARIAKVDAEAALNHPGVLSVVTPADVQSMTRPFKPGRYAAGLTKPIFEYATAVDKVRYVGEPVAAVAARERGRAEDALELISVDYEPLPAVVDTRDAMSPTSPPLFEELGANLARSEEHTSELHS